jgi:putative spermidine/putrescine transport system permease protein
MAAVNPSRRGARIVPHMVLFAALLFFVAPLVAIARFGFQNVPTVLLGWSTLFKKWTIDGLTGAFESPDFWPSFRLSLQLAVGTALGTIGLLLPTAVWVHLKLPKARGVVEFLTVLPYMVPGIALVAGIKVIQPHIRWFLNSPFSLVPFYMVLALPFTYRSIDAGLRSIDLRTLVDASRSLGAGWGVTLRRVLMPNLRASIVSATFLTVAVVLGEFTIASILLKRTLPVFQSTYRSESPRGAYALSVLFLLGTTAVFAVLSLLTRRRGSSPTSTASTTSAPDPAPVASTVAQHEGPA